MRKLHVGRAVWFVPALVLLIPMLLSAAARNKSRDKSRDKSKSTQVEEQAESPEVAGIVNRVIANEQIFNHKLVEFSPRVETYVQYYVPDRELGDVAKNDASFVGRLTFAPSVKEISFIPNAPFNWFRGTGQILRAHLHVNSFALEPLVVDNGNFDRAHYIFEPVRWEYLGDVRCLAIDVKPRDNSQTGAFEGRIWVEDHDYDVVRLNGTRVHPARMSFYVHFDCWRENLQPGLWLPVYIYSQETDMGKNLRYKAQTRLWGYDLTAHREQQEWTNIRVDGPTPIKDSSEQGADLSPVESQRQLSMEAERNVLDRLEKARLIAPPGPVDKVLETVVNNLKVTNHLDNMLPTHCRVMLTSSLESFSLAYTIIVSRGLIDVLPDEASLAMILAPELAHIALGHKLDPKYFFNDRMIISDEKLLASLDLDRDQHDEAEADSKGIEFLKNSPYKDKLAQGGLFLRAAAEAAPRLPRMFGAHLGNGLTSEHKMVRLEPLTGSAPALAPKNLDQIAALPLGSRVQVNAWDGSVTFTDRKAVPLFTASEKMPFRVTPVMPYLKFYKQPAKVEVSSR
jgi:hypothetical protein